MRGMQIEKANRWKTKNTLEAFIVCEVYKLKKQTAGKKPFEAPCMRGMQIEEGNRGKKTLGSFYNMRGVQVDKANRGKHRLEAFTR